MLQSKPLKSREKEKRKKKANSKPIFSTSKPLHLLLDCQRIKNRSDYDSIDTTFQKYVTCNCLIVKRRFFSLLSK